MPDWKTRLIETIPEERSEWESEDSIYLAFSTLYDTLRSAVARRDKDLIRRCFEFAEWCYAQEEKDLWNAAGVSFYEHLADDTSIAQIVHQYMDRDLFTDVRGLIEHYSGVEAAGKIANQYVQDEHNE